MRWLLLLLVATTTQARMSPVVIVRDPATPNVPAMVAAGLKKLTGAATETEAWHTFVSSNDVVGIKISTRTAPLQATRRSVVDALVAGLESAGVAATNIWVFDRDPRKMQLAGYTGPQDAAIIGGTGWDAAVFYENRLVGKLIWGDLLFGKVDELDTRSHFPKLLTQKLTKLINVPVLQDHDPCGLAGGLYNISVGLVDNYRRFEDPRLPADAALFEIAAHPAVAHKLVLNVLDALVAGYAGGPEFKPQYSWPAGALYFSSDPVAVDNAGLELLQTKRREKQVPPLRVPPGLGGPVTVIEAAP